MECILEKLDLRFAEAITAALGDARVRNNLRDLPEPYTVGHARQFIREALAADDNLIFAIVVDGSFGGCISATRQQNIHRRAAEIGYYVVPELWGKGIATQALKKLCDYVFENTDVVRLFAEPFLRNAASCRVLEKAGFAREGILRKYAWKRGVLEDMKLYARIADN